MKLKKFSARGFYILVFFLIPNFSYADIDIKLNCRLTITKIFPSGAPERDTKNVVVEVYQTSTYLSILPNDVDLGTAGTGRNPTTVSVNNLSDSNKWDVTTTTSREGRVTRVSIQIDRNTGVMTYYADFNKGRILTDANGACEKVDTTKKKF